MTIRMTGSILCLLSLFTLINARQTQPRVEDSNTIKILKQAAQDADTVVNIISDVKSKRRGRENINQPTSESLIKEELDILSEDAEKLREHMLNVAAVNSDGRVQDLEFDDDLKSIQSDAAFLYQDTEDLIKDAQYKRKRIKTHTDLAFDRDLELLRNQTGRVLKDVRSIRNSQTDQLQTKKNKRRRKHRRKDKVKGIAEGKDKPRKQPLGNEAMLSDISDQSPLWRDPRCEEMLNGRDLGGGNPQPEALTLARSRGHGFDVSWMGSYLQACPQCTVPSQGIQCPLTNRVLEMKKWANELQELLTHGCVKPAGCTYPGTCCIAADVAIEQTVAQITDMLKRLYEMFNKKCAGCYAQDGLGDWSAWSEWSSCATTCGRGSRSRFRRCLSGQSCTGSSLDTEQCTGLPDCCVEGSWSSWDNWASCSVTCGRGQTTRSRRCSRSATNVCAKPCAGTSEDIRVCEAAMSCCVDGNWGTWSRWSACSSTCGDGRRTRTRTCSDPPPSSCGRGCPGELQQSEPCSNSGVSVNGNWGSWQAWSACSATCGTGFRNRRRACDSPGPGPCGRPCVGSESQTDACDSGQSCCVDGNWAPWESWAPCSVSCGRGQTNRRRRCSRPAPNNCGKQCVGDREELRSCAADIECCVDGNWATWSRWSACSSTCGDGRRTRTRTCSNPPPSSCGRGCPGDLQQTELCSNSGLSVNGNWGSWQVWSACSATCGTGFRNRRRACDSPGPGPCGRPCVGSESQTDACDSGQSCCVDGNWGSWQAWSACSATCDIGSKQRYRSCDNPPANYCGAKCNGEELQMTICVTGVSCKKCEVKDWARWAPWSRCSASCGNAVRSRSRLCAVVQAGDDCGAECPGRSQEETQCVGLSDCPVDGSWGSWQTWSQCSVTCGRGVRERTRRCDNPPASENGQQCPGRDNERQSCENVPCPVCVDGSWGTWEPWAPCSVTCDRGTRERRRSCDSPPANECGQKCLGREFESGVCETGTDCVRCVDGSWSTWEPWAPCSVTCDRGTRERRRSCDNPPANECGQKCLGREFETNVCDTGIDCVRCVDGSWGAWLSWSACSVTCDRGTRERRRSCDSPPANECGQQCLGREFETNVCDTGTDCVRCVDGNWGAWRSWSSCSVTCDRGTRERRRSCDSPPANECGQQCSGREFETNVCETGTECLRCVDGNWGAWRSWSSCSVTCDSGTRERRRSCDSPPANECGQQCSGREFETNVCETGTECLRCVDGSWGAWQSWGQCSVTCGRGTRERKRSCDSPPANECGQRCPGREFETNVCETGQECVQCVNGNWGSWSSWSACPVSCGDAVAERRRQCNSPAPSVCGFPCAGSAEESRLERCGPPEINGNWGSWSSWSACPVSCGDAVLERRRQCNSPAPNVCGLSCTGPAEDSRLERCGPPEIVGQWSSWTSWSDCSVSCGIGSRLRSRTCSNPAPAVCGSGCPGQTDERVTCRGAGLCGCEVKEWTTWASWSACSATCGYAIRSRSRACVVVQPGNDCGSNCAGSQQEDVQCAGLVSCSALDQWSAWSYCSVTCRGRGVRERFITTTTIVRRGDMAVATNETRREVEECVVNQPECPVWGQWSACSATCRGQGVRERIVSMSSGDIGTGDVTVESNATRKELESCQVLEPECPSWGQWSACSVTCRGQGFRERIISTSRIVGTAVETDATRKEVEDCYVSEPDCPYGDATWAQWDSWCPCDCRQGVRTRRRDCEKPSLLGDSAQKVPIALCQGEARNEEGCDTRLQCPECITNCQGKPPGQYPSCLDCSAYMSCQADGNGILAHCSPENTEWDAFVKSCVAPPSPSCTLHDCVDSCQDKADGTYHSCFGCNFYVECSSGRLDRKQCPDPELQWNQHTRRCEPEKSPTCTFFSVSSISAIPGGAFQRDATDTRSPEKHGHRTADGRIQLQKSAREDRLDLWGIDDFLTSSDGTRHVVRKTNLTSTQNKQPYAERRDHRTISNCKTHCRGAKEGKYPSCRGCDYYVICTQDRLLQQKLCPGGRQWDDHKKGCRAFSSTCSTNI